MCEIKKRSLESFKFQGPNRLKFVEGSGENQAIGVRREENMISERSVLVPGS
jgi:hypothetical protein